MSQSANKLQFRQQDSMMPLKRWSILVLTASTLLFVIASSAAPRDPEPRRRGAASADVEYNPSTPARAPHNESGPTGDAHHPKSQTYNYYGDFRYIPQNSDSNVWSVISQATSIISAALVAIFTLALVVVSYRQWSVAKITADAAAETATATGKQVEALEATLIETRKAADAAKQSADVASKALSMSTRGIIEIHPMRVEVKNLTSATVYFTIVNTGARAVVVEEQVFSVWSREAASAYPATFPMNKNASPAPLSKVVPPNNRTEAEMLAPLDQLVASSRSARTYVGGTLVQQDPWVAFQAGTQFLCLSGYVRYYDQDTRDSHETWVCQAWHTGERQFKVDPAMPQLFNRSF